MTIQMDKSRVLKLADRLDRMAKPSARPKIGFNMLSYTLMENYIDLSGHNCGTVCCAAGHAILAFGSKENVAQYKKGKLLNISGCAAQLLGMDPFDAKSLIFLKTSIFSPRKMAKHLRELAARADAP